MSAVSISAVIFAVVFGGALCGMALRAVLPEHHRSPDSRDQVKLGMGLIATMAVLLLGMLIATAKGAYDTQSSDLTQLAARIVFLDRVLAHYGPVTAAMFVSALPVSCAILLILEMDKPYEGIIRISSAPLGEALGPLGK